jgi:hypothetical protein
MACVPLLSVARSKTYQSKEFIKKNFGGIYDGKTKI